MNEFKVNDEVWAVFPPSSSQAKRYGLYVRGKVLQIDTTSGIGKDGNIVTVEKYLINHWTTNSTFSGHNVTNNKDDAQKLAAKRVREAIEYYEKEVVRLKEVEQFIDNNGFVIKRKGEQL